MNITFLIGGVLFWSILFFSMKNSVDDFSSFFNIPSILIVLVGSLTIIVMSYSPKELINIYKSLIIAIKRPKYENINIINKIIEYSEIIKKDGILEVQELQEAEENQFLKEVLQDLIDNISIDDIKEKYETFLEYLEARHYKNIQAFENLSSIAGSMGMIGTLIGLVAMLLKMDDPNAIGPAMAIALLTTLYGSLLANGFANSIAVTLTTLHQEEELHKKIILKGIILTGNNISPKIIKTTLYKMLSESDIKKNNKG